MQRLVVFFILLLLMTGFSFAEPWKLSLESSIGLTQNTFSDNWQGGSSGSVAWSTQFNFQAEKQITPSWHNRNVLKPSFGQTHTQDQESKKWLRPAKSTDQIDLETVWRLTKGWVVDPYASGRLESQFLDQSDTMKTRSFNPMRLTESIGFARTMWKGDNYDWTVKLGTSVRQNIDRDVLNVLTNTRSAKTVRDGGIQIDSDLKTPLSERLNYTGKLTIFQAMYNSKSDELKGLPNENYWRATDVNWENVITGRLSQYIAVSLTVQWLYDKELDLGGRFKQTMTLGFSYLMKSEAK
ncbi:MAG: DUF3078 domain-containing protein, partial [bacterium]|nr:DUF3078 domain-containing protein [bacterium]